MYFVTSIIWYVPIHTCTHKIDLNFHDNIQGDYGTFQFSTDKNEYIALMNILDTRSFVLNLHQIGKEIVASINTDENRYR